MKCASRFMVDGVHFHCDLKAGHTEAHHGGPHTWVHVDASSFGESAGAALRYQKPPSPEDLSDADALAVLRAMIGKGGASNREVVDAMYVRDGRAAEAREFREQVVNLTIALVRKERNR